MGFSPKGISKLSELTIDDAPDKAEDIAELVLTTQGDILYRDPEAARLPADYGVGYNFLHAANTGLDKPEWLDIQAIIAYMTGALNVMAALPTLVIPGPPDISVAVAEDHSGGGFTATPALTIPVPTTSEAAVAQAGGNAVSGARAYDHSEGVPYTDETTEANDDTIEDMTLLPETPAVDDAYYFGYATAWDWVNILMGVLDETEETYDTATTTGSPYTVIYNRVEFEAARTLTKVKVKTKAAGDYTLRVKSDDGVTTYQTHTIEGAGADAWITFTLDPYIEVVNGSRYRMEVTRPSAVAYAAAGLYNGTLWKNIKGAFGGTEFDYTNAMGFFLAGTVAGAGVWTIVWEYWNGSVWGALSADGFYDSSNGFRAKGKQSVAFHRPDDWTAYNVDGSTFYWIRGRVSSYTSVTVQPLGTRAWIGQW